MAEKKKKNSKKPVKVPDRKKLVRDQRINIALNDAEMRALQRYFEKYKITNKAKFWLLPGKTRELSLWTVSEPLCQPSLPEVGRGVFRGK